MAKIELESCKTVTSNDSNSCKSYFATSDIMDRRENSRNKEV